MKSRYDRALARELLFGHKMSRAAGRMTYPFMITLMKYTKYILNGQRHIIYSDQEFYNECIRQAGLYWKRAWHKINLEKLYRNGWDPEKQLWYDYRQCVVSFPIQVFCRERHELRDGSTRSSINPNSSVTETK